MAVTTDQDITGVLPATGGVLDGYSFTGVSGFAAGAVGAPSIYLSTDTTTGWYRAGSNQWVLAVGGAAKFQFGGTFLKYASTVVQSWSSTTDATAAADTAIARAGPNSIIYGPDGATTTSRTEINKATASIANAAATSVLTITIPNAAHSASILVRVTGSLGAGGAIGANEATATNCYVISITRTAGVNATAAISSAFGAAATAVAGAATVTCTAALASVSGAVGASNTIDIQVTISRSGGSSTNHTCITHASLLNANATGITLA